MKHTTLRMSCIDIEHMLWGRSTVRLVRSAYYKSHVMGTTRRVWWALHGPCCGHDRTPVVRCCHGNGGNDTEDVVGTTLGVSRLLYLSGMDHHSLGFSKGSNNFI